MYEAFFQLTQKPFRLTPDASFFFPSTQHRRALAFLEYGLHEGEGFVVITGEPGTGKSTLVSKLMAEHSSDPLQVATVETTRLTDENLVELVVSRFGLNAPSGRSSGKTSYLEVLRKGLLRIQRSGRRALLVVDEAQNLPQDAIEELRMLSNFVTETQPLLQTFLVGQPTLRHRIEAAELEQLRQRITASFHLSPFNSPEEVQEYVEHRLTHADWQGDPRFADEAWSAIHELSGGTPRTINMLCDRLLLYCYLEAQHDVDEQTVRVVAEESGLLTFNGTDAQRQRHTGHDGDSGDERDDDCEYGLLRRLPRRVPSGQLEVLGEAIERLRAVETRLEQFERRVHVELRMIRRAVTGRREDS